MKVSAEPIGNSQVTLNVAMEAAEVDEYLSKAYNRLVRRVHVPGFRKGKTPRDILERHVGKDTLFQEALEDLLPKAYQEALEIQKVDAIDRPQIELVQTEPLIFKATVSVQPTVKLGDYKGIRHESKPDEVGDKEVAEVIEQLRHQHAILVPVDRPVQFGDTVTINIEGEKEGESFPIREGLVYEVTKDARLPLPGFAEKLEGMEKDEERSFILSYPVDYEVKELAGQEHSFKVTAGEVKEKKLPAVDNEFAKGLGSEDVALLRQQIDANLKAGAEARARAELEQRVIDTAVELSEIEYPPVLADREIERLLDDEARRFAEGITGLENYLKSISKTLEEHKEELRPMAEQRVIRSLVLREIAEAEKIKVEASEIDKEIDKMASDAGEQAEGIRKLFSLPQARDSIEQSLLSRKTVDLLAEIASGSA